MHRVLRYIVRRLILMLPTILMIIILNFLILQLTPGDVADVLAGLSGAATQEYMADLRKTFGLDQPILVQLWRYVWNVVRLNLGYSFYHNMPVSVLILKYLPATLLLMSISIFLAIGLGVVFGVTSARYVNRPIDGAISVFALLCYATPTFWIGLMMIVFFSVKLGWFPTGGMITIGPDLTGIDYVLDLAKHIVLPGITLALFYIAIYTRLMRASMLEVYGFDYVRTAFAKGLTDRRVAFRHVLRNALLPLVTLGGMQIGYTLGGAVLTETVFGWPGLGRLASEAILQRDHNLLMGLLLTGSVLVLVMNIVVDLVYAALDPRVEIR
jgi:peptide/nickel transport system permease protein